MTRRRFFAPAAAFTSDYRSVTLEAEEARHLRSVLRLKPGDEVYVFNGQGKEFHCSIEDSQNDRIKLKILDEVVPARPESPLDLTLAVALLKSDKFDLVVQKATELGVRRVVPVMTALADIRLRDVAEADNRVARWRRIALEAAKQSGRALVPEVEKPISSETLLRSSLSQDQLRLMFSERDGQSLAESILSTRPLSIIALVGSEGGLSDEEMSLARENGWSIVTLGGRTLRAETAAIAVTVLLQHAFGDLG